MSEHLTVTQLRRATQQTQEWITDLVGRGPIENEDQAYSILRAVLHAIRDRLTAEEVAHLGSQLPMIVRGFYFEGWRPSLAPNDFETPEEFHDHVKECLHPPRMTPGLDIPGGTRAVLEFLTDHVDAGALRHVTSQLPDPIAALFPEGVKA